MSLSVFALVLLAAAINATWNFSLRAILAGLVLVKLAG